MYKIWKTHYNKNVIKHKLIDCSFFEQLLVMVVKWKYIAIYLIKQKQVVENLKIENELHKADEIKLKFNCVF